MYQSAISLLPETVAFQIISCVS